MRLGKRERDRIQREAMSLLKAAQQGGGAVRYWVDHREEIDALLDALYNEDRLSAEAQAVQARLQDMRLDVERMAHRRGSTLAAMPSSLDYFRVDGQPTSEGLAEGQTDGNIASDKAS